MRGSSKRKIDWRATMGIIDSLQAWAGEHETFIFILFMLPFAIGLSFLFEGGDGGDYGGD
ncbi:putative membrane protein [Corynebacterium urealyticum DSM 7111]|nr:putative membrane protein [Corynebacterium urealyticum DSM 7111]